MLFSYAQCETLYGNHYQIKKMVQAGQLYKITAGIYSDVPNVSDLELVVYRYPYAVFTMNSAFYYHGLTDVIPNQYYLATLKDARKIPDKQVKQSFCRETTFGVGIISMKYQNTSVRIYNVERMLIELIRNKNRLPFDYYKEIIESYRRRIHTMDIEALQEYVAVFPKQNHIMETIQLEVL